MVTNLRTTAVALVCALTLLAGTASAAFAHANNEQTGLVNVNVQDLALALPISVALPIGIAANVCNVSVALLLAGSAAGGACDATTDASAESIAQAIARASGQ